MLAQHPLPARPLPELPEAAARHAPLRAVLAHWNAARQDQLVPRRADLTMQGLKPCLSSLVIYELLPDDVIIRLAGTATRNYWGADATGHSLKDFTDPNFWLVRFGRIQKMVAQPCGWWFTVDFYRQLSIPVSTGIIALPIREVGGSKNLGMMSVSLDLPVTLSATQLLREPVKFGEVEEFCPFSIGAGLPTLN